MQFVVAVECDDDDDDGLGVVWKHCTFHDTYLSKLLLRRLLLVLDAGSSRRDYIPLDSIRPTNGREQKAVAIE